ncbi:MgtC/SapB family protein [Caldisalinibacter kiritimatiensis]|uniref:Putative Mg2+ transport protein n=1 Tax=Caldisalinibacter kiritimatiensis TaxID=1304284 RepID=R1AVD4_9FIRM|nr:MgtC/SapB family protein [Caldisalinibacter kiritimatiensis]EOD00617.1 Putative Mg2+ transport protein [Caldisalinibacter kiritimatiensis]
MTLNIEQIVLRLFLSIILSGLIGLERETVKRPAGFRTHILVCVGSTLIMLVGIYIFEIFRFQTKLDPARLGAQVISGIGFLGAGTIIKEGNTVKGLTTAAGLWAVACIGLAVGAGFYIGAIITSLLALVTLLAFTKLEKRIKNRLNYMKINLKVVNKPGQIGKIGKLMGDLGINIDRIEVDCDNEEIVNINMIIKIERSEDKIIILDKLRDIEGIIKVYHSK